MAVLPATQKSQSYDGEVDNLRDPKTQFIQSKQGKRYDIL